ncbi:uncharacterized protein HD556DRAFT_1308143 [Suillus plorans]|uniref:GCM domain-containing protein n=1 Tax=Suillus plorans TaxID=116603 RepID=A0A9P7DI37_9AGAM|nr:uncharacterized protein HD556DRAFT_1308143 [Suillus plorans]KAG1794446.1 hypothetical protein HD556DRAFT_1308143 [Suillus plorans]
MRIIPVKKISGFSHTETVTTQPRTATPNEHFRVDVSVRVFESEHHSQHYTSGVHTTPPLQHPPVTSQQYTLDVHPTPPLQHPPAPPQPTLDVHPTLPLQHPPAPPQPPVRDQPYTNWPIPSQVSNSTTRMIDEPPRQNLQKPPATSIDSTDPTARTSAVHQPQAPTGGDIEWDVWPDGHITRIYSCEDAKRPEVNDFHVHWACEGLEWQEGVCTRRHCNGVIVCANHESKGGSCAIVVRPTTTKKLIAKQLKASCSCGAMLVHNNCGIIYDLFKFSEVIKEHPRMGATQLVMGRPGINGPQESVATISPLLLNTARVNHERKKVFTKRQGKDIIADFTEFQHQHPDFVIYHTFEPVAVVITQLPIMLSFLVKNHSNGIISDAAHGFWAERNDLLIISSVFSDALQCWVPEYERQNIILTDDLFANVIDFSQAERAGFINAYVEFWMAREDNTRPPEELAEAAGSLLKGCRQHFHAQVTRIKKISGVVPPALTEVFANRVLQLLQCQDLATFKSISASLIRDYPKAEGWLNWWMADGRAEMLFTPFRRMPDNLWYNLEEAMHWRIYCSLGKFHGFVAGLRALQAFSEYWQLQSAGNSSGIPLFYGNSRQFWKKWKDELGMTHPSRAPEKIAAKKRARSDGRPPDTARQLLGNCFTDGETSHDASVSPTKRPRLNDIKRASYKWSNNLCWLDTLLELLFIAVSRDFEMGSECSKVLGVGAEGATGQPMRSARKRAGAREARESEGGKWRCHAEPKRYRVREMEIHALESLVDSGWMLPESWRYRATKRGKARARIHHKAREWITAQLSTQQHHKIHARVLPSSYDRYPHWQTVCKTRAVFHLQLQRSAAEQFNGDSRSHQQKHLPADTQGHDNNGLSWHFPQTIRPLDGKAEERQGVVYDIIGRAFFSPASHHFIAHYITPDKHIYDYDGMKLGGHATVDRKAKINTHVAGTHRLISPPP